MTGSPELPDHAGQWAIDGCAGTEAALDRLASYESIRQLVAHYAFHLDRRDIDSLAALYVEDVKVTRTERGRDLLRAQLEDMLREVQVTILTTGTHRFPNDANFALRAGWVSLLTGNSERAYRFLTTGQRIGYPEEKRENATLLLAIAAAQTGAFEDAQAWYEDLKRLDDDWLDPATIETLEWPEELKASLRQLAW